MSEVIPFGPDLRYGHIFGMGTDVDLLPKSSKREAIIQRTLELGWSGGCPVVDSILAPSSPYEPAWMMDRYAETNMWFRRVVQVLAEKRGTGVPFYKKIALPQTRLKSDPEPWIPFPDS